MLRHTGFIAVLLAAIISMPAASKVKVACIGNSITYGYGLPKERRNALSYPAKLQQYLGDGYEVANFGHNGATLLRHGHRPYVTLPEYTAALDFRPDIAVIHLGVNDTDPRNWPNYNDEFVADYCALIDTLRAVKPEVRILVARLSPLRAGHKRFRTGTRLWRLKAQQAIEDVARIKGVELIDFDAPLRDRQNLIYDNIHPDSTGYDILARTVRSGITGDYGGLSLPVFYSSGMVLQRYRPLTIRGRADAGAKIALTLDGVTYRTVTDNRGDWSVETAPLADGTYTLTVTDGHKTITCNDVKAGEVWIASGQSNMWFPLADAIGGKEAAQKVNDPDFRVLNMRPVNHVYGGWNDSVRAMADDLRYFVPEKWETVTPANAGRLSAVAFWFGQRLRDSLNVPVGIVINSYGGATTEGWIDINTLEEYTPEALLNWRKNDYVQPWAQGRANEESPAPHRHSFEPSYLFATGMRPLGKPDVAGIIWYQGESNAHNIELHEQLFPMLTESWRKELRRPDLPFIFVQLSSLNRPSWPEFRDSQRRLAERVPYTYMAVSSDKGDSLDVHPRDKQPIGHRLALQALKNIYGHNITAEGPRPLKAIGASDGRVMVEFAPLLGNLTTSDGNAPLTFELAETEGMYRCAEAAIEGNSVILRAPGVAKPRYVRYGWQPFTRANLINTDSLPASTFKIPLSNMNELYEIEAGYDRGVSAPFAGRMPDGTIIVAGGANFPCDNPLGPDATKKYYKGIYKLDPQDMSLSRFGSMPEPAAYGATVNLPQGVAFIGGNNMGGSLTACYIVKPDASTQSLPSLPATVDNTAAALIGNTIYVAGGNVDGKASRAVYALDLSNLEKGWKKLGNMPGNPRVQPAVAAAGDKLYVMGGFDAPKGKVPTLENDCAVYDPSTGKWQSMAGPHTAAGDGIAPAGATAVTLSDGRIAVVGGVNAEVFGDAIINPQPDYLYHPVGWYRFNPSVLVFNPATGWWAANEPSNMQARAGAAVIPDADGGIYIFGGELKPRIRTNQTIHVKPQ